MNRLAVRLRRSGFGLLLVAVSVCAVGESPRIKETSISRDTLQIEFDQPMLTWRGGSDTALIVVSPPVNCSWFWQDDTELACSAKKAAFKPATAYQLNIPVGLWSQQGEALAPIQKTVVSGRPTLTAAVIDWHSGQPKVLISAEQAPVTAEEMARVLTLQLNEAPIAIKLETATVEQRTHSRFHDPASAFVVVPTEWPSTRGNLLVSARAGLRSSAGPVTGEAIMLLQLAVNEAPRLVSVGCGWTRAVLVGVASAEPAEKCEADDQVTMVFSRRLAAGEALRIARGISGLTLAEDDAYCRWECADDAERFRVSFNADAAGKRMAIALPAKLRTDDGDLIVPSPPPILVFGDHPASVQSPRSDGLKLLRPNAEAALALELRNLKQRRTLAMLNVDTRSRKHEVRLPKTAINNRWVPWQTPAPRSLSRDGGLILAGMRDDSNEGYALAVAPFNVIASADSARVMVWASAWDTALAIANASIELLEVSIDGQEKVLARSHTGVDGVGYVSLSAPQEPNAATSTPMLRISHAGKQSVIPVRSYWSQLSMAALPEVEDSQVYDTSDLEGRLHFGVSERLLYRPGDTVHFRVWPRQRDGNRLRQTPGVIGDAVKLKLTKGYDVTLDSWMETRDRWGSVAGQRPLSATLPDGDYCISSSAETYDQTGACFRVARFDSQAVWAKSTFDRTLVRPGEPLRLAINGGFYSGGAAVGALVDATAIVAPVEFNQIYPAFARFDFSDAGSSDGSNPEVDPLSGFVSDTVLDAKGNAQVRGTLPLQLFHSNGTEPIAIGEIRANVSVTIPGSPASSSPLSRVVYAAHERYVGLGLERGWLRSDADPVLEAVIVNASGGALSEGNVTVRIERLNAAGELARCTLRLGQAVPCPFRAPTPGFYRLIAAADGAAPVAVTRYFYTPEATQKSPEAPQVALTLLTPPRGDQAAVLRLQQPFRRANALFVIEYDAVLRHWVQEVTPDSQIRVAMPPEWTPGVSVRVLLREIGRARSNGALDPTTPNAVLRIPIAPPKAAKVTIELAPGVRAPGEEQLIRLHNPTATQRLVTMAIVDDSVHQQAAALHEWLNPRGREFLGQLEGWKGASWHGYGEWQWRHNLYRKPLNDAVLANANANEVLSEVSVTGSRLSRSSLFNHSPIPSAPPRLAASAAGEAAPMVRSRFLENAYWNPGETLAPGERRTLRVRLPDNLTRWRMLAWSSDEGDSFDLTEATFETTLPLEIRAGLPTRLIEGDEGSATITARVNATTSETVKLEARADGSGVDSAANVRGNVAPQALLSTRLPLKPTKEGNVSVLARAATSNSADALSSKVTVQSRSTSAVTVQTGWLDGQQLTLAAPLLPIGAKYPRLSVTVAQGTDIWRDAWLRDLRDYPHRCWEQTLSRGLGAAIALQSTSTQTAWPQAKSVVDDTLRDAATFVDSDGYFRYFAGDSERFSGEIDPVLSAYTLRGFQVLTELGHSVPSALRDGLRRQLTEFVDIDDNTVKLNSVKAEQLAVAVGALASDAQPVPAGLVARLWQQRGQMGWFGRSELLRAAATRQEHAALTAQGLDELRTAGTARGLRRVLEDPRDWTAFMGSPLRDQCAIIATLFALDLNPQHRALQKQWLRGLNDLYAGATESLDSQASVQCLLALRAAGSALSGTSGARVALTAGAANKQLQLTADSPSARWESPFTNTAALTIRPLDDGAAALSYSAEVSYVLDQRNAPAQATGMQLTRSVKVLRNGDWQALEAGTVSEGEWLRTTLKLVVPAMRYFVAVTDTVPGGLVTRDVRLGGVAGARLQQLADPGSWWFDSRQTGATEVRFYAEQLPPGDHEVHYYAQATHAGHYLALPAVAELMYGRSSRATTASNTLIVLPRNEPP